MIKYPIAIGAFALILAGCGSVRARNPAANQGQMQAAAVACRARPSASDAPHAADYREVSVIATGSGGAPVSLSRDDLRLSQGGTEIAIQSFEREPASVGILVDTSGSMDEKLPQARNAITEFIDGLPPDDDIFLFAFSSRAYLLQDFTTNHQLVLGQLSLLRANGETALFDTIVNGLLKIRHGCYERKALFVLTDGLDNASSSRQKDVIASAAKKQVPIYSIGIGNSNAPDASHMSPSHSGEENMVDAKTLTALAEATGAKTYLVREVGDGELLKKDAALIADAIGSQYSIGFIAASSNNLKLEVRNHPGATVAVSDAQITVVSNPAPSKHN